MSPSLSQVVHRPGLRPGPRPGCRCILKYLPLSHVHIHIVVSPHPCQCLHHLPLLRHLPVKVDEHLTGSDLQIEGYRGAPTVAQAERGLYFLPRTSNDVLERTPQRLLPTNSPHGLYYPTYQQRKNSMFFSFISRHCSLVSFPPGCRSKTVIYEVDLSPFPSPRMHDIRNPFISDCRGPAIEQEIRYDRDDSIGARYNVAKLQPLRTTQPPQTWGSAMLTT